MTAVNRCEHILSGSQNSHGVSVDTIIYFAVFFFWEGEGGCENETADKTVEQCTVSPLHAEIALKLDLLPYQIL